MTALLSLDRIGLRIGDKTILRDVSFALNPEEVITIVGPNGAGKSSLLSVVLGLRKPTAGKVISKAGLRIGYVPQFINRDYTIPVTVDEFVRLTKAPFTEAGIAELFDELQLQPLKKSLLSHLSGGELRRVLLARALLNQPEVLVLDEPTAGIDVAGQTAFYQRLDAWRERRHFAILMVSHDLHLVMASTDRVICLNQHICCQGKPINVINDDAYIALFGQHSYSDAQLGFYSHHSHPQGNSEKTAKEVPTCNG